MGIKRLYEMQQGEISYLPKSAFWKDGDNNNALFLSEFVVVGSYPNHSDCVGIQFSGDRIYIFTLDEVDTATAKDIFESARPISSFTSGRLYRCLFNNAVKPKKVEKPKKYETVIFDDGVNIIRPDGSTIFVK